MTDTLVERSATGRRWRQRQVDSASAQAISEALGSHELVGRILAGRGVTAESAAHFLAPRLRDLVPDPLHLHDMDRAVDRVLAAVEGGEPIGILGDYDADGATSSALMIRYLTHLGIETHLHIPDRIDEGYGPSRTGLDRLAEAGCQLILCLDSGTTAFEVLQYAADQGQDVVVVDHHIAEAQLPASYAVINPNRQDQTSPCGDLAAVGVTFLFLVALNSALRKQGKSDLPDLMKWLDLVAVGTICDVVALTGLNRAMVVQGLKVLTKQGNPGLTALQKLEGSRNTGRLDTRTIGFGIGPRINAGGRIGRSDLACRLLIADDPREATAFAERLDAYNIQRRTMEKDITQSALASLDAASMGDGPIVVAGKDWHPGVVGIVASRLVDRFHRPAIVLGIEQGVAKGSGRSIESFDLGQAVIDARCEGLLEKGGGHAMAAGMSLRQDRVDAFRDFLAERYEQPDVGTDKPDRKDRRAPLVIDSLIAPGAVSIDIAGVIDQCAPFGQGNPEPVLMVPEVRHIGHRVVGKNTMACSFESLSGDKLRGLAVRAANGPLGKAIVESGGRPLKVAGRMKKDEWQGRDQVTFFIDDVASADGT